VTCDPASRFPDPRLGPAAAPVAWGGDLEPATLVDAYRHGIFPWPTADGTLYWWSPDPRAVIPLAAGVRVSRSLRRTLRRAGFRCSVDHAFVDVVCACADRPGESTWIIPELIDAYDALHARAAAHSVEVWDADGALVGGLFGVSVGAAFTGESMFHRATDASKVALVYLVEHLRARDFRLLDTQLLTPHLTSLGAVAVPREVFLRELAAAVARPPRF
jgi:leucyl/phenylalanyl-tRNA---protein transferase